ncbi:hypothetical protein WNZ14_15735 [Hoeflea sp. AS60]|uniref:hypothetical protein n=1 Tax=Hoeflea sp. AS60 TaxID=3135780 RepID=UPI003170184A
MGFESVVVPGVQIGNGAIIAARTVVTSDVPDYAIVAGSPGRVLRHRFPAEVVQRLLKASWWIGTSRRSHATSTPSPALILMHSSGQLEKETVCLMRPFSVRRQGD